MAPRTQTTPERATARKIASRSFFTKAGNAVYSPEKYLAAGGELYSSNGCKIKNPKAYSDAIEASVRQNTDDPKHLYHYTTNDSLDKISKSGSIRKSTTGLGGPGTYLTTKPPRCKSSSIAMNNYGRETAADLERTQGFIRVDADKVKGKTNISRKAGGRNVWIAKGDVSLQGKNTRFGRRFHRK